LVCIAGSVPDESGKFCPSARGSFCPPDDWARRRCVADLTHRIEKTIPALSGEFGSARARIGLFSLDDCRAAIRRTIPIGGIKMSVSGIFGSGFSSSQISSQYQLTNSEFQQLGKDLASGNLSAAQSDFAVLQQAFGQKSSSSSSSASVSPTSSPIAQAWQQLSSDLKSANLTGAQKDYSTIQQDMQSQFGDYHPHNHHRVRVGAGGGNELNDSDQLLQALPSPMFATSASAAQQQYATLAQQLQALTLGDANDSARTLTNPISMVG
jgi:hypothetical protein